MLNPKDIRDYAYATSFFKDGAYGFGNFCRFFCVADGKDILVLEYVGKLVCEPVAPASCS